MALPIHAKSDAVESPVTTSIALVNMPFAMADRPSIQCGLLKAGLRQAGYEVDVFYLNLEFAAEFGADFYRVISSLRTDQLLGEWLFSGAAFGTKGDEQEYRRHTVPGIDNACRRLAVDFERLCQLRNEILPSWIERWTAEVSWSRYGAVGFTSTFEQNTAALALARRIKERHPEVTILFGGANFDGTMGREYVRALPFIDYAVVGEGDKVLPQIIDRLVKGEDPLRLPGVLGRRDGKLVENGPAPRVDDMNSVPDPDYDEYFSTLSRLGTEKILGKTTPVLLFETSRGCWWGEKQHCTFCGLNNNGMKFRSKSSAEAIGQLERLSSKYKSVNFEAVDNIIDHKYIEQLCGSLSQQHNDYRIFYEIKANLNLNQLRTMARAGITRLQPGIESLNSHILTLMRKGVTMLRNVRLLKWAHYYGMHLSWNILTGFPGETEQDYADQLQVVPRLRHLPPPVGVGPIWLERFSPYFFDSSFPIKDVRPLDVYRFIYPQDEINLAEVAYFFDYEMGSTLPHDRHEELREQIAEWKAAWQRKPFPTLVYRRAPGWIKIIDRRSADMATHAFQDHEAAIYELCGETDRTVEAICKHLAETKRGSPEPEEVRASLEKFCALGLMLEEKDRFLSLAHPVNRHW